MRIKWTLQTFAGAVRHITPAKDSESCNQRRELIRSAEHLYHVHRLSHEPRLALQGQIVLNRVSFADADLKGVDVPHQDALVLMLQAGNFEVNRVIIDSGSKANILFRSALLSMKLTTIDMMKSQLLWQNSMVPHHKMLGTPPHNLHTTAQPVGRFCGH